MPNYETVPLQFAMGVLQARQAVIQKRAELRELQETRRVEAELEASRQRIQMMGIQMQASTARAGMASQEKIAETQAETWRQRNEMQLQEAREKNQIAQQNLHADAMTRLASGQPAFLPNTVPHPTEEQSQGMRVIPVGDTGKVYIPAEYDQLKTAELDKLSRERDKSLVDSLIALERVGIAKRESENSANRTALMDQKTLSEISKNEAVASLYRGSVQETVKEQGTKEQKEALRDHSYIFDEFDEDDPLRLLRDMLLHKSILQKDSRILGMNPSIHKAATDVERRLRSWQNATEESEKKARTALQGYGYTDPSAMGLGASWRKMAYVTLDKNDKITKLHTKPVKGSTPLMYQTFTDLKTGKVVGEAFYKPSGAIKEIRGKTPYRIPTEKILPSPQTESQPGFPQSSLPPAAAPATTADRDRLQALEAKDSLTQDEADELQAILLRLGAPQFFEVPVIEGLIK